MRIGIGSHLGGISIFASQNAHPGNYFFGCLMLILKLAFLPFWLVYMYLRWCIKNNNENNNTPIYLRPWVIVTAALVIFFLIVGIWCIVNPEDNATQNIPQSQDALFASSESNFVFEAYEGYDTIQSLFLSLNTNDGYATFLKNVQGSGLEYRDRYINGGQFVEVWVNQAEEHTNKLEVTFYNVGNDNEYIRTAEYWYTDSAVRISLHNKFENYEDGSTTLCIIDANEKVGASNKVIDFGTIADAMDYIIGK